MCGRNATRPPGVTVILRQVYADAPGQSAVVGGMGPRAREAATEVDALFRELFPEVARQHRRKSR